MDPATQAACTHAVAPGDASQLCDAHRAKPDKAPAKSRKGSVSAAQGPGEEGKKRKAEKRQQDQNYGVSLATRRKRLRKLLAAQDIPVRTARMATSLGASSAKSEAPDGSGSAAAAKGSSVPSSSEDEFAYEVQKGECQTKSGKSRHRGA